MFFDERGKLLLWVYRNSLWVRLSGENRRIFSVLDIGNLCGCESDYLVVRVVPKVDIEVVEVSSCGTHYDGLFHSRNSLKMSTKYNTPPPIIQCFKRNWLLFIVNWGQSPIFLIFREKQGKD